MQCHTRFVEVAKGPLLSGQAEVAILLAFAQQEAAQYPQAIDVGPYEFELRPADY